MTVDIVVEMPVQVEEKSLQEHAVNAVDVLKTEKELRCRSFEPLIVKSSIPEELCWVVWGRGSS